MGNCIYWKVDEASLSGLLQPLKVSQEPCRDIALPDPIQPKVWPWYSLSRYMNYMFARNHSQRQRQPFLGKFWQTRFKHFGTRLNLSRAYHQQSDGSTQQVNQCLEQYLRSMTSDKLRNQASRFSLAEWLYNTSFHTASNTTQFQIVYGTKPSNGNDG